MVLLGNKGDMVHLRQVSSEEGDILAKDFDCNFREVAAADQVNEVNIDFIKSTFFATIFVVRLRKHFTICVAMFMLPGGRTKHLF